jgi:hypothetical protein
MHAFDHLVRLRVACSDGRMVDAVVVEQLEKLQLELAALVVDTMAGPRILVEPVSSMIAAASALVLSRIAWISMRCVLASIFVVARNLWSPNGPIESTAISNHGHTVTVLSSDFPYLWVAYLAVEHVAHLLTILWMSLSIFVQCNAAPIVLYITVTPGWISQSWYVSMSAGRRLRGT